MSKVCGTAECGSFLEPEVNYPLRLAGLICKIQTQTPAIKFAVR